MEPLEDCIEATHGDLHLHLEYEGEGFNGEYQSEDPNDQPLLRFRLFIRGELAKTLSETIRDVEYDPATPDSWMDFPNGSYCTNINAQIGDEQAQRLADQMVITIAEVYATGNIPLKRICERLSWIDETQEPHRILVNG